ncbi:hypothetical protein F5Y13DRAFT_189154 [Hypoxylon sp. FL1857]|nr:hypothetical protein F5Y13DRAFT_189154 [Hypoxylon sp. FL1857]
MPELRLMAPRARSALPGIARLESVISQGRGPELLHLLVVPVIPESHSPEEASGDGSKKRRTAQVPLYYPRPSKQPSKQPAIKRDIADNSPSPANLVSLPRELQIIIFSYIRGVDDRVCLGLTCRDLWEVGRLYLHRYLSSFFGQWAGKNIVCVGDNIEAGDYPPGLFSEQEIAYLDGKEYDAPIPKVVIADFPDVGEGDPRDEGEDDDDDEDDYFLFNGPGVPDVPRAPLQFTLFHFGLRKFASRPKIDVDVERMARNLWYRCLDRDRAYRHGKDSALVLNRDEMEVKLPYYFPEDQPWILRNLTTKEFVRAESIALKPEFIRGPNIEGLGFGDIVAMRIFWTSSKPRKMGDVENIHKGVWAGHRLDVTTLRRHEEETEEEREAWSDIGEEVAKEAASIWEEMCGPDWRKVICQPRHRLLRPPPQDDERTTM